MLRITARIAGAQSQKDIFTGLAFGMMDQCFGFTGVEVRLAADDRSAVQAGNVTPFAARLETPFAAEGGRSGTITVERVPGARFDDVDRELLAAAASHLAVAVTRSAFLDSEKRRWQEQQALLESLADLSGHLELPRLLPAVLQHAVTLLGVTGGELAILDQQTNDMVIAASLNLGTDSTGLRMRIGEGAMGLVRLTHEPLIIPDYQAWTGKSGQYEQSSVHAVMVAPLLIGNRLVGAIASVHSDPDGTFGSEDLRLLEMFAPHAAIAIENARLFTEASRRSEEQAALLETLSALSGELELAKVLDAVLNRAVALLGVTSGELALYEEDTGELVIVASHNLGADSLGTRMKSGEGAIGRVAKTRVPLIIPHYQEWAGHSQTHTVATFQSVLAAPLLIGTRLVGVIAAVHSNPRHAFGEEGLRLITFFASQAAVAIENARLFTSEKKRAEEQQALLDTHSDLSGELVAARRAAETASGSTSQFLANISNELRTPVNAVIRYSEMVQDQAEKEGRTGYVPDLLRIRSAGRELLSFIDDVLDLSRIEGGKVELSLEEFPVRDMVRDVTATVQPLIVKNGNRLLTQFDNAVRMARADLTRMRQVLFHLLRNASKLTERGDIRLTIRRDGNDVIYEVSVIGAGMTAEQAANLFDPFVQADSSSDKHSGGTGLGLAISRQFCRLMGGDITVMNEPGKGSTFTARVPVEVKSVAETAAEPVPERIETEGAIGGLVPVNDDDPALREPVRRHPDKGPVRTEDHPLGETAN